MRAAYNSTTDYAPALCTACGTPFDSQYFDESSVVDAPNVGETVVLAEFELPPQYCGVLEYFAQFTDEYAGDRSKIKTVGIEWLILADSSPLFPYLSLDRIVNPWGEGVFPVAIRLPENTTLKFVARGVSARSSGLNEIGGRLMGRFWYNTAHGNAAQRRF
jgi:hypothetical protein